jgi:hypothetical protein
MELMNFQPILKPIFRFIWRNRYEMQRCKLVKVTGWRSCIIDDSKNGDRIRATFLFSGNRHLDRYAGIFIGEKRLDTSNRMPRDPNDTSTTRII